MLESKLVQIPAISYFPSRVDCVGGKNQIKTNSVQLKLKVHVWIEFCNKNVGVSSDQNKDED